MYCFPKVLNCFAHLNVSCWKATQKCWSISANNQLGRVEIKLAYFYNHYGTKRAINWVIIVKRTNLTMQWPLVPVHLIARELGLFFYTIFAIIIIRSHSISLTSSPNCVLHVWLVVVVVVVRWKFVLVKLAAVQLFYLLAKQFSNIMWAMIVHKSTQKVGRILDRWPLGCRTQ